MIPGSELSEERLRTLFRHAAVGVIEALPDGTLAAVNPHLCAMLGYADDELVGQPAAFISDPADQPVQAAQLSALADGSEGYTAHRRYRRKDGSILPVLVSVGVVRDAAGAVDRLVGTIADMSSLTAAQEALLASERAAVNREAFIEAVLEAVSTAVLACDSTRTVVLRNAAQRALTDVGPKESVTSEQIGARVRFQDADGHDVDPSQAPLLRALAGAELTDLALKVGPPGGLLRDVLVTARQIRDRDGAVLGAVAASTDVTAERQAQASLREGAAFHDAVLAASPDSIFVTDLATNANVWSSRGVTSLLGYTEADLQRLGSAVVAELVHPEDLVKVRATYVAARDLADGEVLQIRYRVRHADGTYRWLARRVAAFVRDPDTGKVTQVLGVARDISDIVQVEQRLQEAALHDPLTGLPNRTLLADRLRSAMARTTRTGRDLAVLFCDLDGFKRVNDSAGHAAGDAVLQATAARLQAALRVEDTVARVGGDEFVIILEPAPSDQARAGGVDVRADALVVVQRLQRAMREPVRYGGAPHVVSASIGVTFTHAGDNPDQVLRDADTAMYRAKQRGRDRHEVFDGDLGADVAERGRVEAVLRAALTGTDTPPLSGRGSTDHVTGITFRPAAAERCAMSVAYQPIFDLATMTIVGVEALARLHDQDGQTIDPDAFIPIAEETGLIADLGRHVLNAACEQLAAWHRLDPAHATLTVAINLSAREAGLSDLHSQVLDALTRTGLSPRHLTLELTESVLIDAGRSTMRAITALHDLGVRIAIDDFGTGYASLRYLAELPVTSVKVDRSFTAGLPDDRIASTIVRAVASLAVDLGVGCVVEGIERDDQLQALPPGLLGQGYLLGRPMTAKQLTALLGT